MQKEIGCGRVVVDFFDGLNGQARHSEKMNLIQSRNLLVHELVHGLGAAEEDGVVTGGGILLDQLGIDAVLPDDLAVEGCAGLCGLRQGPLLREYFGRGRRGVEPAL